MKNLFIIKIKHKDRKETSRNKRNEKDFLSLLNN